MTDYARHRAERERLRARREAVALRRETVGSVPRPRVEAMLFGVAQATASPLRMMVNRLSATLSMKPPDEIRQMLSEEIERTLVDLGRRVGDYLQESEPRGRRKRRANGAVVG